MQDPGRRTVDEYDQDEALRVAVPIEGLDGTVEVLYGAVDPASEDQAIVMSVPLLARSLNFGDIVGVGSPDAWGVQRIVEVVAASGHVRVMAYSGEHDPEPLRDRVVEAFPRYALRIEAYDRRLLGISVHPDFDPQTVVAVVAGWLDEQPSDEPGGVTEPVETELGAIGWPAEMPPGPYTRISP